MIIRKAVRGIFKIRQYRDQRVMPETFQGELVYIWYYFDIQLRQIFVYWVMAEKKQPLSHRLILTKVFGCSAWCRGPMMVLTSARC